VIVVERLIFLLLVVAFVIGGYLILRFIRDHY